MSLPEVVTHEEWLSARKEFVVTEKELKPVARLAPPSTSCSASFQSGRGRQ
jgi:hypothetical protein